MLSSKGLNNLKNTTLRRTNKILLKRQSTITLTYDVAIEKQFICTSAPHKSDNDVVYKMKELKGRRQALYVQENKGKS